MPHTSSLDTHTHRHGVVHHQESAIDARASTGSVARLTLPEQLDVADLCSWVDPRVANGADTLRVLVREGVFMACRDDDDDSLKRIMDRPGVEELFASVRRGGSEVCVFCCVCVCVRACVYVCLGGGACLRI